MNGTKTKKRGGRKGADSPALREVKLKALRAGLLMCDVASACGCTTTSLYGAIRKPASYPKVAARLAEVLP